MATEEGWEISGRLEAIRLQVSLADVDQTSRSAAEARALGSPAPYAIEGVDG